MTRNTKPIQECVTEAIDENPKHVKDYHDGEEGAINYLVGQVIKKSSGAANPGEAYDLVREELEGLDK